MINPQKYARTFWTELNFCRGIPSEELKKRYLIWEQETKGFEALFLEVTVETSEEPLQPLTN